MHGGQRNLNVHNVEKHHGQCWTRSYASPHKDSQKRGWKGDRKGNDKKKQKGVKFKGGKAETWEKKSKRKERTTLTKSQISQKNSGQVEN